ncbi:MAG: ribonuclease N1 [Burkholderiales bacterium]|jgi:ribonuclease T1|nr:ribonuclease N1 [Burkholderiales bacterium]
MFIQAIYRVIPILFLFLTALCGCTKQTELLPASGVALHELPVEAHETYALILKGGPFPYRQDGATFYNREKLLPEKTNGYYREYTVTTPTAKDRGACRIVCGGQKPRQPDICYYTNDHYQSFKEIRDETDQSR